MSSKETAEKGVNEASHRNGDEREQENDRPRSAAGPDAMAARTVARANMVVESASQSALKLLVKNGVRLAVASAADARGNAEV